VAGTRSCDGLDFDAAVVGIRVPAILACGGLMNAAAGVARAGLLARARDGSAVVVDITSTHN